MYGAIPETGLVNEDGLTPYEKYRKNRWVIMPDTVWLKYWDRIVFAALVWTATGTVYEVCVVTSEIWYGIFRTFFLDFIFLADTIITCFRAFRLQNGRGRLVTDLKTIQKHYIWSRQFFIDVIACIPFDAIARLSESVFDLHGGLAYFQMLQLLRLLRLGRLFRKIRQSSFYLRLEREYNSSVVVLVQLFTMLVLVNHWFACLWVFIGVEEASFGYEKLSWLSRLEPPRNPDDMKSIEIYLIALYWSVTTTTTIGYGDITPGTIPEYAVALTLEFFGAGVYTYAIGTVAGIISVMEQNRTDRRQKMDSLNKALRFAADDENYDNPTDADLTSYDLYRFREYTNELTHSREYKKMKTKTAVQEVLSPDLEATLMLSYHYDSLIRVRLFRNLKKPYLKKLAMLCSVKSFPRGETIYPDELRCIGIVTRGVASRVPSKRILAPGSIFGQDTFALSLMGRDNDNEEEDMREVKVMTFFQMIAIDFSVLKNFCNEKHEILEHFRHVALRLMLIRWARSILLRERRYAPRKVKPASTTRQSSLQITNMA